MNGRVRSDCSWRGLFYGSIKIYEEFFDAKRPQLNRSCGLFALCYRVLEVELEGVEPSSKRGNNLLSTCLVT